MNHSNDRIKVLIAGIGGASLGTEIVKALSLPATYEIYGCDISPYAYGHYMAVMKKTEIVRHEHYVSDIVNICRVEKISYIIPGGEEPAVLLAEANKLLKENNITLLGNEKEVVRLCSNKADLFSFLKDKDVPIPRTCSVVEPEELDDFPLPCIIKPSTDSGGSSFVQLTDTLSDARAAVGYLLQNGSTPVVQEYIPEKEGEYTIGVLHTPEGQLVGSIAMRRMFHAKLSVMAKSKIGLISSGYSQGLIEDYADLRLQAEVIANLCRSRGPLNIQGRVRNGKLMPFEINPRFSATTYLRSMAGFNEVDMLMTILRKAAIPSKIEIKYGYYMRSLTEKFIKATDIKK